jgi:hypothetical protein
VEPARNAKLKVVRKYGKIHPPSSKKLFVDLIGHEMLGKSPPLSQEKAILKNPGIDHH